MRLSLATLVLLAAVAAALPVPAAGAARLEKALADVQALSPRSEGSAAEAALVRLLQERLRSAGVAASVFDFSAAAFAHSFSSCLRADIPGASTQTLVIAVSLDTPAGAVPGADGSINVALALDLLERMAGTKPALGLTVLFLGAERGTGGEGTASLGTRLFLQDQAPDDRAAVVYLDLRDAASTVALGAGGAGIVAPSWLVGRCAAALQASGVAYRLPGDELQLYRIGMITRRGLVDPWLAAGLPAVELTSETASRAAAGTAGDPADRLAGVLDTLVAAGRDGIPDEWDRHYLLLQAFGGSLIVTEKVTIAALVGVLSAALLYALVFRRGLLKYVRTLLRNAPAVVPIAALTVAFLAAGTAVVQALLRWRGFPGLWTYAPLELLALKIAVALFLYAVLYNLLRRLPFPRNGSFFSAAALFFLLLDIVVIASFDVSFTWYFLWAFVFVFLSALVPRRLPKLLLFLPAPAWGIVGLLSVFRAPALPFAHALLLSPLRGNLLLAGACLPFILVLLRLGLAWPGRGILRRKNREIVMAAVLLSAGAALGVHLAVVTPFSASRPQTVTATQVIEVDAGGATTSTALLLSSPAPLPGARVTGLDGAARPAAASVGVPLPMAAVPSPVGVDVQERAFLAQRNVTLTLRMPRSPRTAAVRLWADDGFVLIDSSFPSAQESPSSYRLLVGGFPPNPLLLELSLPAGRLFHMEITLEFEEPLIGADVDAGPAAAVTPVVRVVRRVDLPT